MDQVQKNLIEAGVRSAAPLRTRFGLFLARRVIRACVGAPFGLMRNAGRFLRVILDPNEIRRRTGHRLRPMYAVVAGVAGERLRVNLNDHIGWRTFLDSVFDPVPVILADILCAGDGVFVDVGANVGTTSIPVARLGHRVIGIEPSPGILSDLSHNIALNSPLPYTVMNLAAVAPETASGEAYLELYSPEGNLGAASLLKNWNNAGAGQKVELTRAATVDAMITFLQPGRLDLIKLDIEGFEYEALQGMQNILNEYTPAVVFEWRPDIAAAAQAEVRDLRELFPAGYVFHGIRAERKPAGACYDVSLLDFDPEEAYENVLAWHGDRKVPGMAGDLMADGRLEYGFVADQADRSSWAGPAAGSR